MDAVKLGMAALNSSGLQELSFKVASTWSGANACYANAACRATAEKYGFKAGEAFMKHEALMNLNFFTSAENWVSGAAQSGENWVSGAANTLSNDA